MTKVQYLERMISVLMWGNGKNIEKKSGIWNMVFSVLTALQSAVIIMIVTRLAGINEAGIVSIAFSTGYLMYTIATYGVRNFQATDTKEIFSFEEYQAGCCGQGRFACFQHKSFKWDYLLSTIGGNICVLE